MKERLDILLVKRGLAASREKAKAVIMSGDVFVNGEREDKAGAMFAGEKVTIEVRGPALKYVSRGGLKLEKAMREFDLDLQDKICMDIGASTGGFTDCMLQNGAKKVYAVDVGHGQLAWKLRNDERVICMEKTNFRYVVREDIEDILDFASADVSFISLSKILPPARALLKAGGEMVCLIKPQFEAGRDKVGKKGVVREPHIHREVIGRVLGFAEAAGFDILHLTFSPVKGPEGNIEYLAHLRKRPAAGQDNTGVLQAAAGQESVDASRAAAGQDNAGALQVEAEQEGVDSFRADAGQESVDASQAAAGQESVDVSQAAAAYTAWIDEVVSGAHETLD